MNVKQEIVRVFYEDDKKVGILFKNGVTEFYMLRPATNDHIDQLLSINDKIQ